MKNLKYLYILLIAALFFACNTNSEPPVDKDEIRIEASKTDNIKRQEPVVFKINNLTSSTQVIWTVTPQHNVELKTNGHIASALFHKSGSYVIKSVSGKKEYSQTLQVIDSIYIPPISESTVVPLEKDEKLKVTYTVNDSSASGKPDIILLLNFTTTMKYPTKINHLLTHESVPGHIVIDGVYIPEIKYQTNDTQEASGWSVLFPIPGQKNNPITIVMNGVAYKGAYYVHQNELYTSWTHTDKIEFIGTKPFEE